MSELILQRYEPIAKIGAGGFSEVTKALDKKIERLVAIKTIPANAKTAIRAVREAKAVALLNHPNIVTLFEFEQTNKNYYLIMEFVEGQTLAELLAQQKKLPVEVSLAIVTQICQAIAYAHEHGVIHRDLKPSNLMILPDGRVKVMDFGIARLRSATSSVDDISEEAVVGTFSYMSPEQAKGEEVKETSDIFSLGVLLYQLLTGSLPFAGATPAQTLFKILNQEPLAPADMVADISLELNNLILKCLNKEPEQRVKSAKELGQKLASLLEHPEPSKIISHYLELAYDFAQADSAISLRERLGQLKQTYSEPMMRLLAAILASLSIYQPAKWLALGREAKLLLLAFIFGLLLIVPSIGLALAFGLLVYSLFKLSPALGSLAAFLAISYFSILAKAFPLLAALPLAAPLLTHWQLSFFFPLAVGLSFRPALAALFSALGFFLTFWARLLNLIEINWLPSLKPLPTDTFKASSYELFVTISEKIKAHPEAGWQLLIWAGAAFLVSVIKGRKKKLTQLIIAVCVGAAFIGVSSLSLINKPSSIKLNLFLQSLTFSLIILVALLWATTAGGKE